MAAATTRAYGPLSHWLLGTLIIALADATFIGLGLRLISGGRHRGGLGGGAGGAGKRYLERHSRAQEV